MLTPLLARRHFRQKQTPRGPWSRCRARACTHSQPRRTIRRQGFVGLVRRARDLSPARPQRPIQLSRGRTPFAPRYATVAGSILSQSCEAGQLSRPGRPTRSAFGNSAAQTRPDNARSGVTTTALAQAGHWPDLQDINAPYCSAPPWRPAPPQRMAFRPEAAKAWRVANAGSTEHADHPLPSRD